MKLKHEQIQYVEFLSKDLPKIKKFYTDVFGWRFTDYGPEYTAFEGDCVDGGFAPGTPAKGSVLVILYSENLEATEKKVKNAGGKIVKDIFSFPGGRRFHFTDPDGNELAVWSDKSNIMNTPITVQRIINAPVEKVWEFWTKPEHIVKWAFASDNWEAPAAENDVRVGGKFKTVMAAKDKSTSFDFTGTYTAVKDSELIEYTLDDGRRVKVEFAELPEGVKVTETFEPETTNSEEVQRSGWQAILDNFKKYAEGSKIISK